MAEGIYSRLYNSKSEMDYELIQLIKTNIGSELAKRGGLQAIGSANFSQELSKDIDSFVKYIFYEAAASLKNSTVQGIVTPEGLIKTPLGTLSLSQIEKAEVILLRLYKIFQDTTCTKEDLSLISNEFYSAMPQKSSGLIDNLESFNEHYQMIQLLKDLLNVGEITGPSLYHSHTDIKYRSLRCQMEALENNTKEFQKVSSHMFSSMHKKINLKIKNIFKVSRAIENKLFRHDLGNKKLLFHGTKTRNMVGVLSRGLVLPKIFVSKGGTRTDFGFLGSGIYFASDPTTSCLYTDVGHNGTRFMLVCNVALGESKKYFKIDPHLSDAPEGFHSVHGVKAGTDGQKSEFEDDEFVIYHENQQSLEYVIEFSLDGDKPFSAKELLSEEIKEVPKTNKITPQRFNFTVMGGSSFRSLEDASQFAPLLEPLGVNPQDAIKKVIEATSTKELEGKLCQIKMDVIDKNFTLQEVCEKGKEKPVESGLR